LSVSVLGPRVARLSSVFTLDPNMAGVVRNIAHP
jgi:hypothetical protein